MVVMEDNHTTSTLSLDDLETSTTAELHTLYETIIRQATPQWASRDFLMGNLAWSIQAEKLRFNPDDLRSQLSNKVNKAAINQHSKLRPGTRLIREWHGKVYEVSVLENGYLWDGRTYNSLSRVAASITGTWQSGPRFFGMRKQK